MPTSLYSATPGSSSTPIRCHRNRRQPRGFAGARVGIASGAEASALLDAAAGSVFPIPMQKAAAQCLCTRAEGSVAAL